MKSKVCAMYEIKPEHKHTADDHEFICKCSVCGVTITAEADFNNEGRLRKVYFHSSCCPTCGTDIEKFVQNSEV